MDNKRALKKILEELNQDKPRIDYVKGMLEVLIGDETTDKKTIVLRDNDTGSFKEVNVVPSKELDEGKILDNMAKANLETVKNLANQSNV